MARASREAASKPRVCDDARRHRRGWSVAARSRRSPSPSRSAPPTCAVGDVLGCVLSHLGIGTSRRSTRCATRSCGSCGCPASSPPPRSAPGSRSPARSCRRSPATSWPIRTCSGCHPGPRSARSASCCSASPSLLPIAAFAGAVLALVADARPRECRSDASPRPAPCSPASPSRRSPARSRASSSSGPPTGDSYREVLTWLLGSLAGRAGRPSRSRAARSLVVGIPLLLSGRVLDGFAFGDTTAASLGIPVQGARWALLAATALLTGALVVGERRDRVRRARAAARRAAAGRARATARCCRCRRSSARVPDLGRHPRPHGVRPARAARRHRHRARRGAGLRAAARPATERGMTAPRLPSSRRVRRSPCARVTTHARRRRGVRRAAGRVHRPARPERRRASRPCCAPSPGIERPASGTVRLRRRRPARAPPPRARPPPRPRRAGRGAPSCPSPGASVVGLGRTPARVGARRTRSGCGEAAIERRSAGRRRGRRSPTATSPPSRAASASACMLARALAQQPRVLLLDEPTNHLDVAAQLEVLDLLARLARGGHHGRRGAARPDTRRGARRCGRRAVARARRRERPDREDAHPEAGARGLRSRGAVDRQPADRQADAGGGAEQ